MKYNPFLNMQGQSLATIMSDDWMDSLSYTCEIAMAKTPRVRKFRPGREILRISASSR